jgi:hypothetical protein
LKKITKTMEIGNIIFEINLIKEESYNYKEPPEKIMKDFNPEKFQYGYGTNYRWNLEKSIFGVQIDNVYRYNFENEQFLILNSRCYVEFIVQNLNEIFKVDEKNQWEFIDNWELTFVSIAYSTCRGYLAAKNKGTFMDRFYTPVIDPGELLLSRKLKLETTKEPATKP